MENEVDPITLIKFNRSGIDIIMQGVDRIHLFYLYGNELISTCQPILEFSANTSK